MKYHLFRHEKQVFIVEPGTCTACNQNIRKPAIAIYVESWHETEGFREGVFCSPKCASQEKQYRIGHYSSYAVVVCSKPPKGSVRKLPTRPEHSGRVNWEDGEVRRDRTLHARDPDQSVMTLEQKRDVMLETRDADGLSMADFSDRERTEKIGFSEEKTLSDLDLILNAKPIDAHNQVENDEKKRIGGRE